MAKKQQKPDGANGQPGAGAPQRAQDGFLVVRSLGTADGGRAGLYMEVAEAVGRLMVAGGKAELVSEPEAQKYRIRIRREWQTAVTTQMERYRPAPPPSSSGQKG